MTLFMRISSKENSINDGVPSKIWSLTSDNDGVKAILVKF